MAPASDSGWAIRRNPRSIANARGSRRKSSGRGITRDGRDFEIALPSIDASCRQVEDAGTKGVSRRRSRSTAAGGHGSNCRPVARSSCRQHSSSLGIGETEFQPIAVNFAAEATSPHPRPGRVWRRPPAFGPLPRIVRTNTAASAQLFIVDFRRTLLGVIESDHLAGYTPSGRRLTGQAGRPVERLRTRMPGADVTSGSMADTLMVVAPVYIVIDASTRLPHRTEPIHSLWSLTSCRTPRSRSAFVVAQALRRRRTAMFDPVLARLRDLGCMGLMMSASPDEGVLLGSARPSQLPPGRGTLVTRAHRDQLVQIAWSDPE